MAKPVREKKIRTFIVDDSQSIRLLLRRLIESDSRFEVIGESGYPNEAFHEILKCSPDILTLDIHMPELNGIELLKRIFEKTFIPAVMISSIRPEEGDIVLESLEAGAIDYIEKPEMSTITSRKNEILNKLYHAAQVKKPIRAKTTPPSVKTSFSKLAIENTLIAIGSSTGGTEALTVVLKSLPNEIPPILIVQHIPKDFSKSLADRLNHQLSFQVMEAKDGDRILPNRVFIAPGAYQMDLAINHTPGASLRIADLPPRNHHKPSVDHLFDSIAQSWKKNVVGVILTGMGRDGANGLLKMKQKGARTIGQDQASCVVYGMPRAANEIGALDIVTDLGSIGQEIVNQANDMMLRKKIA